MTVPAAGALTGVLIGAEISSPPCIMSSPVNGDTRRPNPDQAQHDAQPNIHFPHGGQLLAQILHRRGEGGSLLAVLDRLGPQGLELPDLPAPGDILDEEESFQDNRDHGREQQHADGAPLDAEPARARGRARKDDNMEFLMRLLTHPYSSRRARQSYEVTKGKRLPQRPPRCQYERPPCHAKRVLVMRNRTSCRPRWIRPPTGGNRKTRQGLGGR